MDSFAAMKSRTESKTLALGIYMTIAVSAMFQRVQMSSTGVMATELINELGLTNVDLAVFASAYTLAYMWMQIPIGFLNDRIGTKKVVLGGMSVCLTGSLMFAFSANFEIMKVARFIMGMGGAMAFGSLTKTAAVWFDKSMFQTLTGIFSFVVNIGSILAAGPLAFFVGIMGWRGAFKGLSVIIAVMLGLCFIILKEPGDYPKEYFEEEKQTRESKNFKKGFRGIFTFKYAIINLLSALITSSELSFVILWAIPYLEKAAGYSNQVAANIAMVTSAGVVIGAISVGIYDRLFRNKKLMLSLTSILFGSAMLGIIFFKGSISLLTIMYFIIGYTGNVFFVLMIGMARNALPPNNLSVGLTTFNFINQFTLMAVNFIAALAVDSLLAERMFESGYIAVPVLFAVFAAISAIISLVVSFKPPREEEQIV